MITILEAKIGEKCLLEGRCQVEGFLEMSFTLRESQYGYWVQFTKSFKCDDGKFRNSIWVNKNDAHTKALDIFEQEYHKLIAIRASDLNSNTPGNDVLNRVRDEVEVEIVKTSNFTADDIPF